MDHILEIRRLHVLTLSSHCSAGIQIQGLDPGFVQPGPGAPPSPPSAGGVSAQPEVWLKLWLKAAPPFKPTQKVPRPAPWPPYLC